MFSTVFFLAISEFCGVGGGSCVCASFARVLLSNLTKKGGCWGRFCISEAVFGAVSCVLFCVHYPCCMCVRRKLYMFQALHAFSASFSCVGWFGHKCLITFTDKFGEACVEEKRCRRLAFRECKKTDRQREKLCNRTPAAPAEQEHKMVYIHSRQP